MSVTIATVLNRLQKFTKENDITVMSGDIPVGISFTVSGEIIVKHTTSHTEIAPTLHKAALIIHHKLDELEKQY